jgi:uncharacterized protein YlzI (FlbEa/FlbD family)
MITLHRLGHACEAFSLNPDLIMTVEANPDTVITLTTGTKIVVAEPPERVATDVQRWRVSVLSEALAHRREERTTNPRRTVSALRPGAARPHAVPALSDEPQTA